MTLTAVLDVGGTTLRSALFDGGGRTLGPVTRVATAGLGLGRHSSVVERERWQADVIEQITDAIGTLVDEGADAVVVAFAGPVTDRGVVLAAPTIAGAYWRPVDLAGMITGRFGVPVTVLNELTAAAWRYRVPGNQPFCLITVSSGIGNKVLWGDDVLISPGGHGGEIGHWQVDPSPDAPWCDCGGRGHLGGIASGRGTQAAARAAALRDPRAFAGSLLATISTPDKITTVDLVRAVHAGDAFAVAIVRTGATALARAISSMFTAIGLCRFVVIGGFAQALGRTYLEVLRQALFDVGCFGLTRDEIDAMVDFGAVDDDHSLIGAGLWAIDHRAVPRGLPRPDPGRAPTIQMNDEQALCLATDEERER